MHHPTSHHQYPVNLNYQPPQSILHSNLPTNLLDHSQLHHYHQLTSQIFHPCIDPSQPLFDIECAAQSIDYFSLFKTQNTSQQTTEDQLYSVLCFRRGYSQQFDLQHDRPCNKPKEQMCKSSQLLPVEQVQHQESVQTNQEKEMVDSAVPQEMCSVSIKFWQNGQQRQDRKTTTKNVTKNMGKLLFKWIWTNRQQLQQRTHTHPQLWQQFIANIKQWKKENNITRKYLTQKWHNSNDPTSWLFRTLSAHFFRTKCIAAIYLSNIECKQMHSRRIHRFLQGVSNSSALHCLN